ncbi:MAG: hypothetical protein GY835_09940 [bacterium]|nr:hypothetical protein [bacterium]
MIDDMDHPFPAAFVGQTSAFESGTRKTEEGQKKPIERHEDADASLQYDDFLLQLNCVHVEDGQTDDWGRLSAEPLGGSGARHAKIQSDGAVRLFENKLAEAMIVGFLAHGVFPGGDSLW